MSPFEIAEIGSAVLYCCGMHHKPDRIINLLDTLDFEHRQIEILSHCPRCGTIRAKAVQFYKKTGEYKTFLPKGSKRTIEFIKNMECEPYLEFKQQTIKKGSWVNELIRFNNSGEIFNLNNRKICEQEELIA